MTIAVPTVWGMIREVALRRAIQDARDRRQQELTEVQERARGMRRRLRELTDRSLALGSVRGRFVPEPKPEAAVPPAPIANAPAPTAAPVPVAESMTLPEVSNPAPTAILTPMPVRRDEEVHAKLLGMLREQYVDGFTVGQMREAMEFAEPGKPHTYDEAWGLANNLLRAKAFEVAGFRPGDKGPIRVLRVSKALAIPAGAPP